MKETDLSQANGIGSGVDREPGSLVRDTTRQLRPPSVVRSITGYSLPAAAPRATHQPSRRLTNCTWQFFGVGPMRRHVRPPSLVANKVIRRPACTGP
jgi:hypothetical protein